MTRMWPYTPQGFVVSMHRPPTRLWLWLSPRLDRFLPLRLSFSVHFFLALPSSNFVHRSALHIILNSTCPRNAITKNYYYKDCGGQPLSFRCLNSVLEPYSTSCCSTSWNIAAHIRANKTISSALSNPLLLAILWRWSSPATYKRPTVLSRSAS